MKRFRKIMCAVFLAMFAIMLIVLSRKDWNFARPFIKKYSGRYAETAVDIRGDLYADFLTWSPIVSVEDIHVRRKIGNNWGPEAVNIGRVYVKLTADELFHRTIRIHKLEVDKVNFNLAVWQKSSPAENKESKKAEKPRSKMLKFELVDGQVSHINITLPETLPPERRKVHVDHVDLLVAAKDSWLSKIQTTFRLNDSILHKWLVFVSDTPGNEFPIGLIAAGGQAGGSFEVATNLAYRDDAWSGKGTVTAEVKNWPEIFALVNYSTADLQPPAAALEGSFEWQGRSVDLTIAKVQFGHSDIRGQLKLAFPESGPFSIAGDLKSQECHYADIGAFLPKAVVQDLPVSRAVPPSNSRLKKTSQRSMGTKPTKAAAPSGVFSNTPISFAWSVNTHIDLRASVAKFVGKGKATLIDSLSFHVTAREGDFRIDPLMFRSELGSVETQFTATPEGQAYRLYLRLIAEKLDIGRLLLAYFPDELKKVGIDKAKAREVFRGELAAAFTLRSKGDSYRAAMNHVGGRMAVQMGEGKASSLLIEALGLDLVESAGVLLSRNQGVPVQCLAVGADVRDGHMTFDPGMLSTSDSNVYLTGHLDFPKEEVKVKFDTRPKDFSWGVFRSPLTLNGPLSNIKPGVEPLSFVGRIAMAISLGALVAPVAAIVPFIEPGTETRDECPTVIRTKFNNQVAH